MPLPPKAREGRENQSPSTKIDLPEEKNKSAEKEKVKHLVDVKSSDLARDSEEKPQSVEDSKQMDDSRTRSNNEAHSGNDGVRISDSKTVLVGSRTDIDSIEDYEDSDEDSADEGVKVSNLTPKGVDVQKGNQTIDEIPKC